VKDAKDNFPMALDETNHRIFLGYRKPAKALVLAIDSGKAAARFSCPGDTDDPFYDGAPRGGFTWLAARVL
jgi:hypothetical protein